MGIRIFASRFTPGITADKIDLWEGEKVEYRLRTGEIIEIIIDSKVMSHTQAPFVYECIFPDGERYAADTRRITWWDGKTETREELDALPKGAATLIDGGKE